MSRFRFLFLFFGFMFLFQSYASEQDRFVSVKPIELPEVEIEEVDLFNRFVTVDREKRDEAFAKKLEKMSGSLAPLPFSAIPVFNYIVLPDLVKKFFENLVMYLPDIKFNLRGEFSVLGQVDLYGRTVQARIFVGKDEQGKTYYSVAVNLPKGWKFSDTFPKTNKFDPTMLDLVGYENAWFMFSTIRYKDSYFEKSVLPGLNFFGNLAPKGKLFEKLDLLFRGELSKLPALQISGVIGLDLRFVGTKLQIDVPIGITFSKQIKTTPLSLILFVEEKITLLPTIALAIKGGLEVLFKGQKEPVQLSLTGKYIFPEDLEFYGQMEGELQNFIVPELSIGNLKLGIVTDIALIAETSGLFGWVAGLSLNAKVGFGKSNLFFGAKGALSGDSGVGDVTFIMHGSSYLRDLARFWLSTAKTVANLDFADIKKIVNNVPNIEMEEVRAIFVPRKTLEEEKRVEISIGRANLLGLQGSGSIFLSQDGIFGSIQLPEIIIGPKDNPLFYLTGAGNKDRRGFVMEVDLRTSKQHIYGDLLWGTSLFGGISRRARTDISASGFDIKSLFKWNGVIDAEVVVNIDLVDDILNPENLIAKVSVQQDGLDTISKYLRKNAVYLLQDIRLELDRIKTESLQNLKKKVGNGKATTLERIHHLEESINRKIRLCNQTFSKGVTKIFRPACYVVMDVVGDLLKLLHMQFRKDVTLNVIMVGGRAVVEVVDKTSKVATRSIGNVMKFLSKLTKHSINVRRLDVEASFKQLQAKKPLILKTFDAELLGKRVIIKDISFDLQKIKEFIIALFDSHNARKSE